MLLQPGGDLLTPRIGIALRPLSAEQLGMATSQTLQQLFPRSVTKPIWHFDNIITSSTHPLHSLLPPKVQKHYSTRPRSHCYQLHVKLLHLTKAISFIVYYIVTFYRLRLLADISIF